MRLTLSNMDNFETARQIQQKYLIQQNFTCKKEFSLSYIKYRLYRPFLKLYTHFQKRKYDHAPWTSPASIEIFDTILTKEMTGIEFGSGFSTIFFAERMKSFTSIEHYKGWYDKISEVFASRNDLSIDYKFIPPSNTHTAQTPSFNQYFPEIVTQFQIRNEYFEYFEAVSSYPDEHFDFILVDGRARIECLLNSLPKLKKNGILVLDNSERNRYQIIFKHLEKWPKVFTTTGLTDTTFWFKPSWE